MVYQVFIILGDSPLTNIANFTLFGNNDIIILRIFIMMTFGIISLLIVGASWCLVGIVLGRAPKEGIDSRLVQLTSGLVSVSVSSIISCFIDKSSLPALNVMTSTLAIYFLAGAVNFAGLEAMAAGMQRGPNGIIWGIMQSALIFPFIIGILFFNVALTIPRLIGIIAIVAALCSFAATKNNASKGGNHTWKLFAFLSLAIMALQQNLTILPSYFESAREVPSVFRALASAIGSFLAAAINILITLVKNYAKTAPIFKSFFRARLWLYVLGMQFFSLIFSYTLFYPGMDIMAKCGAGAICHPLMVGSCIVSFTLYAILALKEKTTMAQRLALIFCLIGLTGLCFKADETEQPSRVRAYIQEKFFTAK